MKCDFGRTMEKGGKNAYQSRLKKETMKSNGREKEEMGKGYMAIGEEQHSGLELFGKFIFHNRLRNSNCTHFGKE